MKNKEALKEVSKDIRVRKIYDNGGKSIDRYTITFDILNQETKKWELWISHQNFLTCLGLSSGYGNYFGFSQFCSCTPGRHLGKLIEFENLPKDVQNHIKERMKD